MSVFANIGKFEKKIGLSANEKEIYVINQQIDEDKWINMDDFCTKNGGILNIPLFFNTDAPLGIIRHWAKLILQIIQKVHDVKLVLRYLNTKQLWISRDGQQIRLGHLKGIGKVDIRGNMTTCPDIYLHLENNEGYEKATQGQSSTISPGGAPKGALSSSKKTDCQRHFSNVSLNNAFIAPEILFSDFTKHTQAIDIWCFGIIMYCLMFGKKPQSLYSVYR